MKDPSTSLVAPGSFPRPGSLLGRFGAFLVDLTLLSGLLGVIGVAWVRLFQIEVPPKRLPLFDAFVQLASGQDPMVILGLAVLLSVAGLYFLVGPLLFGTTCGLRLVGLALVDREGQPIGAAAAFARALGILLSGAYFGLGFLWILFDSQGQGFHDRISGTWVVRRNAR